MKIRIAQLDVQRDLAVNQARMITVLDGAHSAEWVVFPEGILSGYFPDDPQYLSDLNAPIIESAIRELQQVVISRNCNCLFGSALPLNGRWYNSVILLTRSGARYIHHKVELSALDQQVFTSGTQVSTYTVDNLTLGIQSCRELLFPQTWSRLKAAGAQIVFHINNAVQPHDQLWEHILITRAIEQSLFVCSVNNAASPQALASYLISPAGQVLLKTSTQQDQALTAEINLSEVIADLTERTDY